MPLSLPVSDDSPRAFPSGAVDDKYGGMSLRDWFAGQALGGLLAAPDPGDYTAASVARYAYQYADAMLAERARSDG